MFYFMVVKFGMCVHVCIVAASRGGGQGGDCPPMILGGKGRKKKGRKEKEREKRKKEKEIETK